MNAWYVSSTHGSLQAQLASLHPTSQLPAPTASSQGNFVFVMEPYLIYVIIIVKVYTSVRVLRTSKQTYFKYNYCSYFM